jgi:hypothetical protein
MQEGSTKEQSTDKPKHQPVSHQSLTPVKRIDYAQIYPLGAETRKSKLFMEAIRNCYERERVAAAASDPVFAEEQPMLSSITLVTKYRVDS